VFQDIPSNICVHCPSPMGLMPVVALGVSPVAPGVRPVGPCGPEPPPCSHVCGYENGFSAPISAVDPGCFVAAEAKGKNCAAEVGERPKEFTLPLLKKAEVDMLAPFDW